jgi:hypothetical protein
MHTSSVGTSGESGATIQPEGMLSASRGASQVRKRTGSSGYAMTLYSKVAGRPHLQYANGECGMSP